MFKQLNPLWTGQTCKICLSNILYLRRWSSTLRTDAKEFWEVGLSTNEKPVVIQLASQKEYDDLSKKWEEWFYTPVAPQSAEVFPLNPNQKEMPLD